MSTSENGINAFVRYQTFGEDRRDVNPRLRDLIPDAARVQFNVHGREFYSYGRHFPLARFVPAKRGRRALWLINGDRWGGGGWSLTSRHQAETRAAIATAIEDGAKTGRVIESLIVPFSALDGAGIEYESVRPLHVRPDRNETFTNTAKVARGYFDRPLPTRETLDMSSRISDPRGEAIQGSETLAPALALSVSRVSRDSGERDTYALTAKVTRSVVYRGFDYGKRYEKTIEDASMPSGFRTFTTHGEFVDYDPAKVTVWLNGSIAAIIEDTGEDHVALVWKTERHWLGDSLFTAERRTRDGKRKRMRFLSSFDYNERSPLYFLAALPASSRARTVDMAYEDLAPAAVHAALARGLAVKRQGDIFAIPTPLTDADISARAIARTRLSFHTRGGTNPRPGELGYRAPLAPAALTAHAKLKRDMFYSGFRAHMRADVRPTTEAGFRKAKRAKLAEYREAIERHTVRIAAGENICQCAECYYNGATDGSKNCAECGLPIYYHGYSVANAERGIERARADYATELARPRKRAKGYCNEDGRAKLGKSVCYSRALNAWRSACDVADASYKPRLPMDKIRETLAIHGTGHTATEVAVCKGGVTYARGILRHDPSVTGERRGRDHAAVKLDGALWYLVIRNTVPRG